MADCTLNKDIESDEEVMNLNVMGPDGTVVQFKVRRDTLMRKLMNAYCDRKGLALGTIRFLIDGEKVKETDTPKSLDLQEGDMMEIYQVHVAGHIYR